jgi:cytoskeletal protein CcmA (bactofilin family)
VQVDFLAPPPQPLRATLDQQSDVTGKLSFSGPTRIDGNLAAMCEALTCYDWRADCNGTIRATTLVVLGRVDGDVLGAERVEIGPHGALRGNIETRALVVHDGAQLDGDCRVAPPAAPRCTCCTRAPSRKDRVARSRSPGLVPGAGRTRRRMRARRLGTDALRALRAPSRHGGRGYGYSSFAAFSAATFSVAPFSAVMRAAFPERSRR